MFVILLAATFLLSLAVSLILIRLFGSSLAGILQRIVNDAIHTAWLRYVQFALAVAGVSSGVRIGELEKYIIPPEQAAEQKILTLNAERWILEIYRTLIETLQGIAWALLVFFIFALIAYVVVRIGESRRPAS